LSWIDGRSGDQTFDAASAANYVVGEKIVLGAVGPQRVESTDRDARGQAN
jgi:hypothetical protein